MASAGPKSPGTTADAARPGGDAWDVAWSNTDNAKTSNNSYATATEGFDVNTHYLKATNFDFTIPSGSTIDGITVSVERKADGAYGQDLEVKIIKGGAVGATNKADLVLEWPSVDTVKTYGGISDKWGETWTYSDINSSSFGVAFAGFLKEYITLFVDFISITVTYTEGGGGASAVPVIMNQYRQRRA